MDTTEFIREAAKRGVKLDHVILRELYRTGRLVPFGAIRSRRVSAPLTSTSPAPHSLGTRLTQLRASRDAGRFLDLATVPYRPRLEFERPGHSGRQWWNGLIYSWHQLLVLPELQATLDRRRYRVHSGRRLPYLPDLDPGFVRSFARYRRIALMATALEARYLPALDPEWIHLRGTSVEEWQSYRDGFDPAAIGQLLDYPAKQARADGEYLLWQAHSIDPIGISWGRLLRRAPSDSWKDLKNAALSAMDLRETAEILLRYYEDLSTRGAAEPLPDISPMAWEPLGDRLSYRQYTLDQDLMSVGLSPHPRVVLAVEGDTEEVHVPLVWRALEYPNAPSLFEYSTSVESTMTPSG